MCCRVEVGGYKREGGRKAAESATVEMRDGG